MHGDLVFENTVFDDVIASEKSCMTVSTTQALPEKDFKAVLQNGEITKVGIEFFNDAVSAQPLYKLKRLLTYKYHYFQYNQFQILH